MSANRWYCNLSKKQSQVSKAVTYTNEFSTVSGLKINLDKSVLFPIKPCNLLNCGGILIKEKVTYLGIIICKNAEQRVTRG